MSCAIRAVRTSVLLTSVISAVGCVSPPSVAPLMRVVDRAMRAEAGAMAADAQRDAAMIAQGRAALADAYAADLARAEPPDPAWVLDATEVYVAAREALIRHELALAAERAARRERLLAASQAQQRALSLLEQQDRLITDTVGADLWRLLDPEPGDPR